MGYSFSVLGVWNLTTFLDYVQGSERVLSHYVFSKIFLNISVLHGNIFLNLISSSPVYSHNYKPLSYIIIFYFKWQSHPEYSVYVFTHSTSKAKLWCFFGEFILTVRVYTSHLKSPQTNTLTISFLETQNCFERLIITNQWSAKGQNSTIIYNNFFFVRAI